MHYFCTKTGFDMFDASRAYGFALLLEKLKKEEETIKIYERGIYYLIEGPQPDFNKKDKIHELFDTKASNINWKETLLTGPQRKISGELKPQTKEQIKKAKNIISSKLEEIFKSYKTLTPIEVFMSQGETLLQSMELGATKGHIAQIRAKESYAKKNIKVLPKEWALGIIGKAHLSVWKFAEGLVSIIPQPQEVKIMNWQDIRESINAESLNKVSMASSVAHMAVLLARQLQIRKAQDPFMDRFSALIFQGMTPVGRGQWKPANGGLFPMDFLYLLLDSNLEVCSELFNMWDHVFQIGNRNGCEDIALSLAEFIAYPTLETWERYQKIHLRYLLKEDVHLRAYSDECIKEVINHVSS